MNRRTINFALIALVALNAIVMWSLTDRQFEAIGVGLVPWFFVVTLIGTIATLPAYLEFRQLGFTLTRAISLFVIFGGLAVLNLFCIIWAGANC